MSNILTVYKCPYEKIRLGRDFDGGYIIADVKCNYQTMLSCGISDDISFEEDFIKRYPKIKCYAFDGTIDKLPHENANINFIKKNIGANDSITNTNLHELINESKNIFIKMDIEGSEYSWLKSLSEEQLNSIDQMVIEFHSITFKGCKVIEKINTTHYLIHFHGNNACGIRNIEGINIPLVFECTFLHKKYFNTKPELNTDKIPHRLDMRNIKEYDEIIIDYPPFVHPRP